MDVAFYNRKNDCQVILPALVEISEYVQNLCLQYNMK